VTLIHNPGAGGEGDTGDALVARIAEAGHEVRHVSGLREGWEAELDAPADVVAVAGGDGTVAPVVVALRHRGVPVALIPEGSANNVARTLGVGDAAPPPAAWPRAPRRRLDVARAAAGGREGCFVESAGGGVLADVLHRAAADPRDPGGAGSLRQGRHLLRRAAAAAPVARWGVTVDGRDLSGPYVAVEAMNIRESGPRLSLAPSADPGDGLLDLVLVAPDARGALAALAGGDGAPQAPLAAIRARRIALRVPPGVPLHLDDDPWDPPRARDGWAAVELEGGAGGVEVLVP
jgi:diacylglycerol kinase family enzyme